MAITFNAISWQQLQLQQKHHQFPQKHRLLSSKFKYNPLSLNAASVKKPLFLVRLLLPAPQTAVPILVFQLESLTPRLLFQLIVLGVVLLLSHSRLHRLLLLLLLKLALFRTRLQPILRRLLRSGILREVYHPSWISRRSPTVIHPRVSPSLTLHSLRVF